MDTPVLEVIQTLLGLGWRRGEAPSSHTLGTAKHFGTKSFVQQKPYLQCLCALPALFDRGLASLSSSQSMAYYKLVLRTDRPGSVELGKHHRDYELDLAGAALQDLGMQPLPPADSDEDSDVPIAGARLLAAASDDGADNPTACPAGDAAEPTAGVLGAAVAALSCDAARAGQLVPCELRQGSASSAASRGDLADDAPCVGRVPVLPDLSLPNVRLETHLSPGQRGHYARLVMACPLACSSHGGGKLCCKHRNVGAKQTSTLGMREPEAFLGAWAAAAHRFQTQQAHMRYNPLVSEVRDFMIGQGWTA